MKAASLRSTVVPALAAALFLAPLAGCGRRDGGGGEAAAAKTYQGKAYAAWLAQIEGGGGEARLQAVRAIGAMGAEGKVDGKTAVPALLAVLEERDCRAAAALALGSFGPGAKMAVPALVIALRDEDQEVRSNAAAALEQIGPDAIPPLVAAVQSWDQRPPFYGESGSWFDELVRVKPHLIAGGLIAVALAAIAVFYLSFKLWIRHRERLARIEKGLDPDAPPAAAPGAAPPSTADSGSGSGPPPDRPA